MSILTGKVGSLYIIDTSTAFTTEDTTEEGATSIYQIDDTDMRMWNPNTDITVSTGTLDRTYMDEGVNWFEGKVQMTATGLTTLTVTGEYIDLQAVGEISGWTFGMTIDTGETTEVGDTWKTNMALNKSGTLSLNRYRFDTLFDKITGDDWILVKLFQDATTGFWVKCLRGSLGYTKAINAIDTETLSFVVSSPIAYFS